MINIKYNPSDRRYIFLYGDSGELKELEKHLNKIPSYMFMPSFAGYPKPEVFLNRHKTDKGVVFYYCFAGLWKEISDWCTEKGISFTPLPDDFKYTDFHLTLEEFTDYVASWNLNISPREYQIRAAWLILHYRVSMSQLATRAGKTLIAYMVFRYMLEHGAHHILMVVPNVGLVKQAVDDMAEYQEFFKSETVWSGGELCESSNLTVGTFQSLVRKCTKGKRGAVNKNYNPKFFDKFDVVLIDECHTAKCESIKSILSQNFLKSVLVRFGFSGSIPDENTIEFFTCQSLLGPIIQDIRSKELMDSGFITPVEITQIRINYGDFDNQALLNNYITCAEYLCGNDKVVDGKVVKLDKEQRSFTMTNQKTLPYAVAKMKNLYEPEEYVQYLVDLCKAKGSNLLLLEQMLVHRSKKRLKVMDDLIDSFDKNCIVFGHHQEYLRYLEEHFKERFPDRPVYLIQGRIATKKREKIIQQLLTDKNAILVASYSCVGTGLTLKNVDYGIFAQSFKSHIICLQAIGRGLCLAQGKDKYRLYDLIDCFPTKRLEMQGVAKIKLYKKQKFEYLIKDV